MAKRKLEFENNEYYHVYNRGVDKREIFLDYQDVQYFVDRLQDFNMVESFGNVNNTKFGKNKEKAKKARKENIVEIIAYAINPNHFHLILKQVHQNGISDFIRRVCVGYSMYFNKKHKRSGTLFQGRFKARQIFNDKDLKSISAYVNLNYKVHKLDPKKYIVKTSYNEYLNKHTGRQICWKKDLMKKFKNIEDFKNYHQKEIKKIIKERDILKAESFEENKCFK